jgi:hypothetical protein
MRQAQAIDTKPTIPRTKATRMLCCSVHKEMLYALSISCAVVSAWRGAWLVLDAALLPGTPLGSAALSLGIGCILLWLSTIMQPTLYAAARTRPSRVWWLLDALFSYGGLWCCVFIWRGIWQLWDHALGVGAASSPHDAALERSGWLSHGLGVLLALLVDGMTAMNAAPMLVGVDSATPFLSARSNPSWSSWNACERLRRPPEIARDQDEWQREIFGGSIDDVQ